jgi:spore coat assemly protein
MLFNIGDFVTRNSHDNDILFKIIGIENEVALLKGIDVRLYADSSVSDLRKEDNRETNDEEYVDSFNNIANLDRNEYFYLPGRILHVDGDNEYLERCINFYKKLKLKALGLNIKEADVYRQLGKYLNEFNPDILVITGHDAYYKRLGDISDLENYKNTKNFIKAVKAARTYENNPEKLIIIAGACQSNFEELIKAGANFASSPKRINIHALDPAIVASNISVSKKNEEINLLEILSKTKYGKDGIGGIITNGTMYVGYPR